MTAQALLAAIEAGATPGITELVDVLGPAIPGLYELEATPQDPGWHAEGNVLIHTGMVLDELYELLATRPEAAAITGRRRTALILGAALHDIAKPATTRALEIQGVVRIAAPRHEMRGRSELIPQLMGLGLAWETLELVVDLVGYHITPKFLVIKNRERNAYLRLARAADPELLYWLELANMLGRRWGGTTRRAAPRSSPRRGRRMASAMSTFSVQCPRGDWSSTQHRRQGAVVKLVGVCVLCSYRSPYRSGRTR